MYFYSYRSFLALTIIIIKVDLLSNYQLKFSLLFSYFLLENEQIIFKKFLLLSSFAFSFTIKFTKEDQKRNPMNKFIYLFIYLFVLLNDFSIEGSRKKEKVIMSFIEVY